MKMMSEGVGIGGGHITDILIRFIQAYKNHNPKKGSM